MQANFGEQAHFDKASAIFDSNLQEAQSVHTAKKVFLGFGISLTFNMPIH